MTSSPRLAGWKSDAGRREYLAAYDAAMSLWPAAFEDVSIPTRFGTTHAVVSGPPDAPPLVLLPAATGAGAIQWHRSVADLADEHRVYALDAVGAPGKGTQTTPIRDAHDAAAWLTEVVDSLDAGAVDVVGSSQGGWFALALAITAPDRVRSLTLLAPAASLLPFRRAVRLGLKLGPHMPAFSAGWTIQANFGRRYRPDPRFVDVAATALSHFRYQEGAVVPAAFDDDELSGITCPVLVLIGDREIIYDPHAALRRAASTFADVRTDLIPDAGHLLNMERPDELDRRLLRFLAEVQP